MFTQQTIERHDLVASVIDEKADLDRIARPARTVIRRTGGHTRGPITRLVSPSDLGELIKPFVFLDLAAFDGRLAPMTSRSISSPRGTRGSSSARRRSIPMTSPWATTRCTPVRRRSARGRRRSVASARSFAPTEH